MTNALDDVDAVLFDYGNTLVRFGPAELTALLDAVVRVLSGLGSVDPERLRAVRDRQLSAPYLNGFRESDFETLSAELLTEVAGVEPTRERIDAVVAARCEAFFDAVNAGDAVHDVLESLRRRRRLALVSNYPCGKCIRDTLNNVRLTRHFHAVVVSGEVGWCKPHPTPFRAALDALGVSAERAVYVGDNWLADVQGAKRLGMRAILTEEFTPYQHIAPEAQDFEPDARIATLRELVELLP
jgi:putative hydrolase of the HAD superfamily